MKKSTWFSSAVAGLALLGCSSAGEPGRTGADLAFVAEGTIEGRADLFIDPSVSWRPMTLEQLGIDESRAIPVEVDVYGGVAVAWIRRDETTESLRTRADIVALYRVLDRVEHVTPIAGDELDREGEEDGPLYVPGDDETSSLPRLEREDVLQTPGVEHVPFDYVLIDWTDLSRIPEAHEAELWRELQENHPGC